MKTLPLFAAALLVSVATVFAEVKSLLDAGKTPADIKAALPAIGETLKKNPRIARYVQGNMTAHVEKACLELGGQALPK